jgi:hypothetical protein
LLDEPLLQEKLAKVGAVKGKWYDDKPINMADFENHWKKKRKGCYALGLGRWFRVCRQNVGKDLENRTKLFQILMMMSFGIISIALSFFLYSNSVYYHDDNATAFVAGFCVEYIAGFVCACVFYGILAH